MPSGSDKKTSDCGICHTKCQVCSHVKDGKWLPVVTGYDVNNNNNGFAGILGQEIDGIQIWIE